MKQAKIVDEVLSELGMHDYIMDQVEVQEQRQMENELVAQICCTKKRR